MRISTRHFLSGLVTAAFAAAALAQPTPTPFTFAERGGVATAAVITSESKTLGGFTDPLPVGITTADGAQYSIAGGSFTNAPGTIGPGQSLRVRHVTSASANTPIVTTVTVGDYGTQFRTVTGSADRTPEAFDFGMQTGVEPGTRVESGDVTIGGYNVAVPVAAGPGAEYRVAGGEWTAAAGTLNPGQALATRHTSSAQFLAYAKTYVKVGGVTGYFTTRVREQNPPPPPPPPDADGDGVTDANDQCDDEPGAAGNNGCPVDAATGFPVCDPSPLEVGCLTDLDEFFPVPVGSALQGAIDAVYGAVAGNAGLSRHVDPRIGSYPPGFTNPGPVAPFGMVALGPDTEGPLAYGGYYQHNVLVTGFSHVHMSAGVYKGGYFPALPFTGELSHAPFDVTQGASQPVPGYASPADDASEVAEAGYYAVRLARYGALAELTATERVGLHRYTFGDPAQPGRVLLDVARSLGGYDAASVTLSDDGTLLTGTVHTNNAGGFDVWFAARLSAPFTVSTFAGSALLAGESASGDDLGVILDFPGAPATVLMKLALSYTDQAGAIANLSEMPSWKFDTVRAQTRRKWDRALARIEVEGGTDADRTSFYTALYRLHHFPNLHGDVDGRYRGPDRKVHADTRPHYSQFSSWDSYRGQNQLQAEIFPDVYQDMVRSLLAFHEQNGALPRWQQGPRDAAHMSGDPVVPFIGEAWCRGALDEDLRAQLWPALANLPARRDGELAQLGYLSVAPADLARQVEGGSGRAGTTLEYGIADFSLALMAQHASGDEAEAIAQRSLNYRNLLDPETGWIRPRLADGSWLTPFAPELGYGFQEGTSWQYSWLAMHDYAGVIARMGGDATVDQRLDVFFNFPAVATTPVAWPTVQNQATAFGIAYYGNQYAPGNEHDLEAPYVYNYSGAPWKSQAVARAAASIYTPTPNGLPGNDDLGALSGWLLWTMSGLYPMNPGSPVAVVGSPVFEKVTLKRPGGDLVIEAPGTSATHKYVQSVELDGVAQERSWLLLPRSTATVRLTMGATPNTAFGAAASARPPSLSTHGLAPFGCTVAPQADLDADGVADGDDQCPGESGLSNLHGCPVPADPPAAQDASLHAVVDACREFGAPEGFCRGVEALIDGAAGWCRQVSTATNGAQPHAFCARIGGVHVAESELQDYEDSWTHRALALQDRLGYRLPLAHNTVLHTHNSFNAQDDNTPPTLSGSDFNQYYDIPGQLRMDIRAVEMDVHWAPGRDGALASFGREPMLCHGRGGSELNAGCTTEKPLRDGLRELRAWLDAHPDEVVLLYIEDDLVGTQPSSEQPLAYATTARVVDEAIGELVFRPADHGSSCDNAGGSDDATSWLNVSRQQILDANKQVLLFTETCRADTPSWNALFHQKNDGNWVQGTQGDYEGFDCFAHARRAKWTRVWEDSTVVTATAGGGAPAALTPDVTRELMRCGLNMPGFDRLVPDDGRLEAAVWSWAEGEPAADDARDCALHRADGRFVAAECGHPRPRACVSDTDPDDWRVAQGACPAGTHFSVPANGYANERLKQAKAAAGVDAVWLDYSDALEEGRWIGDASGEPAAALAAALGEVESQGLLGLIGELLGDLGDALLALVEGDTTSAGDHVAGAVEHVQDNATGLVGDEDLLGTGHAVAMEQGSCAPDNRRAGSYAAFLGSLHEHSGFSDGTVGKTPADYFAQGRALGLDFMGATEHSDNARAPVTANADCLSPDFPECFAPLPSQDQPAAPLTKWEMTLEQAREATTAGFTAFRGFEWTSDRFGHINVLFSRHDWNAKSTEGYTLSMESFWTWFTTRPEQGGGADGLAVFNHPGREDQVESQLPNTDPAYAFNDFEYRPEADLRVVGVETFGKGGDAYDTDNNAPAGGWYAHALDKGWHVGPVGAEDEHGTSWGQPNRAKTILIARDRSAGALREALFARRFFAIAQNHNDVRLTFTADGQPMGSRLARAEGATMTLSGAVTGTGVHHVDLVTRGGTVLATQEGGAITATVAATTDERWYYLRAMREDGRPIAYSAPVWIRAGGAYPVCGEWIAGDFHVHSTYSHDSYGGPDDDNTGADEAYTAGHTVERQFRIAAARGLDYLAITDHQDIRSQSDPGFGAHGVVPVRSYENSLSGHAQMHGAGKLYDAGDKSAAAVNAMADALRADGGVFQVNHPFDGEGHYPDNAGWKYGTAVRPDTIEVWNIGPRYWLKPFPANTNNDDSTRWWESWLDAGHRIAATGGSDNHWAATTAVQGNGQPTTWLFVSERSEHGVLEALRAGRTAISHQPPLLKGPRLVLEADADGDGIYEALTGDTVPPRAALRVRAFDAQGALLRVIADGGRLLHGPVTIGTPVFEYRFTAPRSTWVRAEVAVEDARDERQAVDAQCENTGALSDNGFPEDTHTTYCRNQLLVTAMSSALYLGDVTPPVPAPEAPPPVTVTTGPDRVEMRSGLLVRTWSRSPFRTERLVDARTGKVWSESSADFALTIDGVELASDRFGVVGQPQVERLANGAVRTTFTLAPIGALPVGLTLTRIVEMYPDVAGMRTETFVHSAVPLAISGYSLDESRPQGAGLRGTIHSFRAGADWREPEWAGPELTVGDAHAGDWRETQVGATVSGGAQWLTVNDAQDARLFYAMERNDYASSMMTLAGGRARAHVDLARDVIYLGPIEEQAHAENPGDGPARHRVVMPGVPLRLEPVFTGLGTSGDDEPWQHHQYLAKYRMPPYRREVTFNSNGVDSNRISTGAKDDMDFAETQRQAAIAAELGVETFILDDGWQARSGDWCPDSASADPACQEPRHTADPSDPKFQPRFPDSDFTAVRALLAPSGMNLGLWMTPLHFNPSAVVFERNPQWACQPISTALLAVHQADPYGSSNEAGILQWNLEATGPDGKAVDYIEGRIRRAIVEWQVKYFKFDFTVWLDCAGVAPADIYMYRESFMAMLDRILADHPDVTIQMDETNDYRLFPFEAIARGPTWYQNGSPLPHESLHANHVLAPFVPLHALGRNALNPGHLSQYSPDYLMSVALLSHVTFFSDLTKVPAAVRPAIRAWTEYYKAHRADLAQLTYPLLAEDPLDTSNWAAFQTWDPVAGRGVLLAYRQDSEQSRRTIRLRNVPDGTYRLFAAPYDHPVGAATAAQLREGLQIELAAPRTARVLRVERISSSG